MPVIHIRGHPVDIDVESELARYDWRDDRWTPDKLIAASPFRDDRRPSFYVNLDGDAAGTWGDSGTGERGGFVDLIARLRDESYTEAEAYLFAEYGGPDESFAGGGGIRYNPPKLRTQAPASTLDEALLDEYKWRHPYLGRRGISEGVQRMVGVGYDRERRAVSIPWRLPDGRLAAIKYRRVDRKQFWYARGGMPIRELVYGINVVYARQIKRAVLTEAEIDAMTVMSAGIMGTASGGAEFNEAKASIIRRSPLEEIVIMADHDAAGQRFKRRVIELLAGDMTVKVAGYPARYKDVNEMACDCGLEMTTNFVERARVVNVLREKGLRKLVEGKTGFGVEIAR